MTNYTIPFTALRRDYPGPSVLRIYRQYGDWLVHRAMFVNPVRGRRQWVVTYAPSGHKLPSHYTLRRAIKLASAFWAQGLDPDCEEHKPTFCRLVAKLGHRDSARSIGLPGDVRYR